MFLRRVDGRSMEPTLSEGDVIICNKKRQYHVSDIVVAVVDGRQVIKRIYGKTEHKVYLLGDNLIESTDSRQYGPIANELILGKCSYVYRKPLTVKKL